jgi:hypothetical protein
MSQFATQNTAITGFGAHSMEEVGELYKALSIGDEYATTTPGNLSGLSF